MTWCNHLNSIKNSSNSISFFGLMPKCRFKTKYIWLIMAILLTVGSNWSFKCCDLVYEAFGAVVQPELPLIKGSCTVITLDGATFLLTGNEDANVTKKKATTSGQNMLRCTWTELRVMFNIWDHSFK